MTYSQNDKINGREKLRQECQMEEVQESVWAFLFKFGIKNH